MASSGHFICSSSSLHLLHGHRLLIPEGGAKATSLTLQLINIKPNFKKYQISRICPPRKKNATLASLPLGVEKKILMALDLQQKSAISSESNFLENLQYYGTHTSSTHKNHPAPIVDVPH